MPGVIVVTGDTYPVRQALAAFGARWDARHKRWVVARAGMRREPMHADRPVYDAIQEAIRDGRLRGVRIEWEK